MMKHEFEELAGYEVSLEDYNSIIEPMYMATNLTKQEFVKTINKKRFALRSIKSIEREMRTIARHLEATCTNYTDWEARERLQGLAEEYITRMGWKAGTVGFLIDFEEKWSCYYPTAIDFYGRDTYKDIKVVKLI